MSTILQLHITLFYNYDFTTTYISTVHIITMQLRLYNYIYIYNSTILHYLSNTFLNIITSNLNAESHSIIHKIADAPSTFPYILVLFLTNIRVHFFFISVVATVSVHKCYEWVNLVTFTRFKSVFANDNVGENVLGANFYIEDVFVVYFTSFCKVSFDRTKIYSTIVWTSPYSQLKNF